MQLNQITFTRFIAALTVVFFHYGNQVFPANTPYINAVITAGPIAVNYFFLLSGFIMAIAYYQPTDQARSNTFRSSTYWLARFARIYPVYLFALLLIAVTKLNTTDFTTALFLNTTLLQAWIPDYALSLNSPGWSLSVEAFFYLCFPFLLMLAYRYSIKKIVIAGIVIWLMTQGVHTVLLNSDEYVAKNALHSFIYYHPLMHINAFILGIIAGVVFKDRPKLMSILAGHSNSGIIITSIALALVIAFKTEISATLGFEIALTNGQLAPLFLLFIIYLSLNKGAISKLFSNKWLVLLGEASFSLYILQRPVHGIYERTIEKNILLPETIHFYLYLLILIVISIASYKLFETPARRIIRSLPNISCVYPKTKQNKNKPTRSAENV